MNDEPPDFSTLESALNSILQGDGLPQLICDGEFYYVSKEDGSVVKIPFEEVGPL